MSLMHSYVCGGPDAAHDLLMSTNTPFRLRHLLISQVIFWFFALTMLQLRKAAIDDPGSIDLVWISLLLVIGTIIAVAYVPLAELHDRRAASRTGENVGGCLDVARARIERDAAAPRTSVLVTSAADVERRWIITVDSAGAQHTRFVWGVKTITTPSALFGLVFSADSKSVALQLSKDGSEYQGASQEAISVPVGGMVAFAGDTQIRAWVDEEKAKRVAARIRPLSNSTTYVVTALAALSALLIAQGCELSFLIANMIAGLVAVLAFACICIYLGRRSAVERAAAEADERMWMVARVVQGTVTERKQVEIGEGH
jgi:hypothetical protein